MVSFPEIVTAPKLISRFPGWSEPEAETGAMLFSAPLEIGGVTAAGLSLDGVALRQFPDCNVVMELVLRDVRGRRRIPLTRICWRSLKGGHSNRRGGPPGARGRTKATHLHTFELNYVAAEGRMRKGNLPYAVTIDEELQAVDSMLHFVSKAFQINNIGLVSRPPWEYDLFHGSGA